MSAELEAKHAAPQEEAWWQKVMRLEPSLVRGVALFVVAVAANVGLQIADQVEGWVQLVLMLLSLAPLIQAWWTRTVVTPSNQSAVVVAVDGQLVAGPALQAADGEPVVVKEVIASPPDWVPEGH